MCSTNIILNILKIHDGHTRTAGNGKKLARRILKKPENKTTRSTLQLGSNTATWCDINLFTQTSSWFYIWQKVSDCCSTGETDSACYLLHDAKCHSTIFQLSTQHITWAVHTNANFPEELPTTILNLHNPFKHFFHELNVEQSLLIFIG